MMKRIVRITAAVICLLSLLMLAGCGSGKSDKKVSFDSFTSEGMTELTYAKQFTIEKFKGGYSLITIAGEDRFFLVPEGSPEPEGLPEGVTVITQPTPHIYLAASSAMDFFRVLDSLSMVTMTSTKDSDWSIPEVKEALANEDMYYVGKYSAPDYEVIIDEDCNLAIESTMIYHSPQIKEKLESMGIPVLVERSSYESNPLGRMEWIKLYGLLANKEEEAKKYFDEKIAELDAVLGEGKATDKTVAYFYISSAGQAIIHKPGDYISKMIEMAGGRYVFSDDIVEDENAMSTMKVDMEYFLDKTENADVLIYNSTIEGDLKDLQDLYDKSGNFKHYKAVKEGNVWCTQSNTFQQATGLSTMIAEMHKIIHGQAGEGEDFQFFHKLK